MGKPAPKPAKGLEQRVEALEEALGMLKSDMSKRNLEGRVEALEKKK